ncbi:MAG: cell division protein FtsA [Muribaculaceae bacterium]|nr:cell division protein FtsA [Muribaculaceae bacterium]
MAEREQGRYIVAFEIGSSKIRGAVGLAKPGGVVDIIAVEEEKLTDKVRYGCIQNMEVSNALSLVTERLQAYPQVAPREITGAYIGLGGRTLWSSSAEVSLDLGEETEITPPIINDLCHQAEATVESDRDVVDVVPVRFTVDNKTQNNPIGTFGKQVGARMTVLSCAPQLKKMLRRVVEERLGLDIRDYVTRPLAEADMTLTDDERRLGCMFVDFGAETVTTAIYKNGTPAYVATLPIGSRNITLDLTHLNWLEERAEETKIAVGNALAADSARLGAAASADGIDTTEVNNYIHARADEIIANIIAQIDYAGFRAEDLHDGIIIVGGGARLRGFNELLAQQSKMKVRMGTLPSTVRLTDGSVSGSGSLDVISILYAAARMNPQECLSDLPEEETTATGATNYDDLLRQGADTDAAQQVRIGHLDDDDVEATQPGTTPAGAKKSGFGSMLNNLMRRMAAIVDETEPRDGEEE